MMSLNKNKNRDIDKNKISEERKSRLKIKY